MEISKISYNDRNKEDRGYSGVSGGKYCFQQKAFFGHERVFRQPTNVANLSIYKGFYDYFFTKFVLELLRTKNLVAVLDRNQRCRKRGGQRGQLLNSLNYPRQSKQTTIYFRIDNETTNETCGFLRLKKFAFANLVNFQK